MSAVASTAASAMTTYGVACLACSRPTTLGICRLVASEYASRESPSIAAWHATTSVTVASPAMAYRNASASQGGSKRSTIASTGASIASPVSGLAPGVTGSAATARSEMPT